MLTLRGYQREAIDSIPKYFNENGGNPLICLPTGTGKALVIAAFIKETLAAWPETRILVLTHVKELIAQDYAELLTYWPEAPAGIYSASLKRRDMRNRIIFAGIQSIHNKAYDLQTVDLVIIDECHLIPRRSNTTYRKFLNDLQQINPYMKVIGLTATPYRMDSGYLHKGEGAMFSDIAYEANIRDMIDQGYLTRPVSKSADAQIDTSNVGIRGGEFIPGQLEAAATHPEVVAAVADEIVANGRDRRGWIVFGCGEKHCKMLRDAIVERGITCEAVFGNTPGAERDRIIGAFKRQEIRALASINVLSTGFNAKHVDLVALARPTKSTGLYIQIVGRGTRLFPGKEDCLVLDFGGNISLHGPVDQPKVKSERKKGETTKPQKKCLECGEMNDLAARFCVHCDTPFPPVIQTIHTEASSLDILSSPASVPQWVPVTGVQYRRHEKPGKPPSMRVVYSCGLVQHSEWVTLEHEGYARGKAIQWWNKRLPGAPVPNTVEAALAQSGVLPVPTQIAVRPKGQFTEILGVKW